ncbi:MAG: tRNA guanosine(34) transglycosylase Tgt [Alphaproteobacteria bacterium]|nr:MAG: tRNA guanosine(34) transglycosylase Tgt [Alphaproteobacteria bacterium]
MFKFEYKNYNGARLGKLTTPHGVIETPAFIFCATKASIKGVPTHMMKDLGTQVILSNTYHLMLKPGSEYIENMGGLQKFTGWRGPMLTDSGGFQIFSLGHGGFENEIKRAGHKTKNDGFKMTEEGATFKSYYDGSKFVLTPERSIQIQRELGADLIVVLDECMPYNDDKLKTYESMELSHRWAKRSLDEFAKHDDGKQKLYGIIHGGVFKDLRAQSAAFANEQPYFGYAIGGTLGKSKEQMYEIVEASTKDLNKDKPVHLLGIGGVRDIFTNIHFGIDTFDCVHPTRIARHGGALAKKVPKEFINLRNTKYKKDQTPIEEDCKCPTCQNYTKGYLHHLLMTKEPTVISLLTIHNVYFMNKMMADIREGIRVGNLKAVEERYI